jgi:hypothetical protein
MWLHLLAIAGQIALLYVAQLGFNWLTRKLEIDRLTLVANKSRCKAVLRALITRLNVWLWICGIYTTIAWHIVPFFPDLLLEPWFSGRRLRDFLIGVTALAVISVVGRTIYVTSGRLRDLASGESSHWESVVAVLLADLLQVGLPIVTFIFVLPLFSLPPGIVQNSRELLISSLFSAPGIWLRGKSTWLRIESSSPTAPTAESTYAQERSTPRYPRSAK